MPACAAMLRSGFPHIRCWSSSAYAVRIAWEGARWVKNSRMVKAVSSYRPVCFSKSRRSPIWHKAALSREAAVSPATSLQERAMIWRTWAQSSRRLRAMGWVNSQLSAISSCGRTLVPSPLMDFVTPMLLRRLRVRRTVLTETCFSFESLSSEGRKDSAG